MYIYIYIYTCSPPDPDPGHTPSSADGAADLLARTWVVNKVGVGLGVWRHPFWTDPATMSTLVGRRDNGYIPSR